MMLMKHRLSKIMTYKVDRNLHVTWKIYHLYLYLLICTSVSDRSLYPRMWVEYNDSLRVASQRKRQTQWYASVFSHQFFNVIALAFFQAHF